jgi:putative addiction module killer protein
LYPVGYYPDMDTVNILHETSEFSAWFLSLRDIKGKARIAARVDSARHGNFGDCKALGDGVCEMRVDFGPGYRVYYAQEGLNVYLLVVGGDKSTQKKDISRAKELWRAIKEERQ